MFGGLLVKSVGSILTNGGTTTVLSHKPSPQFSPSFWDLALDYYPKFNRARQPGQIGQTIDKAVVVP